MSLYEHLNVEPNADADAIKAAHRQMVKRCHPDQGGDREEFEKGQHAYDVLKDPAKRARYDETGDDGSKAAPENAAMSICISHFMSAMQRAASLDHDDLVKDMKHSLRSELSRGKDTIAQYHALIEKTEKAVKRLKCKEGSNFLLSALEGEVKRLRGGISQSERQVEQFTEALKLSDNFSYEVDQRDESGQTTERMFQDMVRAYRGFGGAQNAI